MYVYIYKLYNMAISALCNKKMLMLLSILKAVLNIGLVLPTSLLALLQYCRYSKHPRRLELVELTQDPSSCGFKHLIKQAYIISN